MPVTPKAATPMIEVEAKFRLSDVEAFEHLLISLGGSLPGRLLHQSDEYFQHPCRSFDQTDEALRLRTVAEASPSGEACPEQLELCYKGPRLDPSTKTRREIEFTTLALAAETGTPQKQSVEALRNILLTLGFSSAGWVRKKRRAFDILFENQSVCVSVDYVDGLPPFAELEIVCSESQRAEATSRILRLAETLGLRDSERRSYLELLENQPHS
jgi:adenylate cyclase class 2